MEISQHLPPNGTLLDFGCANGELLERLHTRLPDANLYGLDPYGSGGSGYVHLRNSAECEGLTFDAITAFEVLEHLGDNATQDFFALVHARLAPHGICVVSAPNMLGPALFPKLLHARITGGSALGYSQREAVRAALLLKPPARLPPNRSGTLRHKGYDWRVTRSRIAQEFHIVSESTTPFPWLWWGFNSQWFCTFRLSDPV